ncbi:amino acid ABC transporter substrate-binding protein [Microbacterium album]|uniref:Branched chain amino acid ABC transporter substrate-binding protein n=1 Tax=Microbacterium album TaxID=2053191 RepID=A0A917IF49_9MICO|nr:amino acid ABC transporter substrate-binding protein [Microbacterium album]GGH43662.1 branched chain amino acid ABC transporter substrate-binding protein [Microbacterium album]
MRTTMHARTLIAGLGLAALIVTATACAPDADDAGSEAGPIRIGASLPLTGEFSQGGQDTQQGYQVWEALQNEQGGLLGRDVEIIVRDDATNQNTVVTNYNALIDQEGVDLLLGTQSSLLNIPASAIAERAGMLYICPSCASPEMFNRGFEYIFFSQQAIASTQAKTFADWVAALPDDQRPATAAYPSLDDPFSSPVVNGVREVLEAAGIETVYADIYPATTKNFDAIVSGVRDSGAEIVVQGAQFEDGVNFVRALNRAGYSPEILYQSSSPTYGAQYIDGVGADNAQGVFFSSSYHEDAETFRNDEFVAKYREMFGGTPPEDAADGFAAGQVLAAAVEAVGGYDDQAALADWLRANEVETILGTLAWNEDGSPKGEFLVGQWQDGVSHVILPEGVATTDQILRWRGDAF